MPDRERYSKTEKSNRLSSFVCVCLCAESITGTKCVSLPLTPEMRLPTTGHAPVKLIVLHFFSLFFIFYSFRVFDHIVGCRYFVATWRSHTLAHASGIPWCRCFFRENFQFLMVHRIIAWPSSFHLFLFEFTDIDGAAVILINWTVDECKR